MTIAPTSKPTLPLTQKPENLPSFGKIYGRFFLKQHLQLEDDDTADLCTISEVIETFPHWPQWIRQLPQRRKQLFTMFETSDVHPDIIDACKLFDNVIVPFDYLKDILTSRGVKCEALNWYTSPLILQQPQVVPKPSDSERAIFLYVGTNDLRKNTKNLALAFNAALAGTKHRLVVKTNHATDLVESPNIQYITQPLNLDELAALYNACDYVVSFTRGEGVGLPMLEALYFGRPVIAHKEGVFRHLANDQWIPLACEECIIDYSCVPAYLQKVFYGTWWDVSVPAAVTKIKSLLPR